MNKLKGGRKRCQTVKRLPYEENLSEGTPQGSVLQSPDESRNYTINVKQMAFPMPYA